MAIYTIIAVILIIIGLLGTFLPGLPGTPIIFAGAIFYGYVTGFRILSLKDIFFMGVLVILAEGGQYFFSMIGARKSGASKYGLVGAMIGLIAGTIFIGPLGLILGPLGGAAIVELLGGRSLIDALKIGIGSFAGFLSGMLLNVIITLIMVIWIFIVIF